MNNRLVFAFLGVSNAGKTKLARRLVSHYKHTRDEKGLYDPKRFSTGDMFRQLEADGNALALRLRREFFDKELNAPDHITLQLVGERLNAYQHHNPLFLDGFPRSVPQAQYADERFPGHVPVYVQVNDPNIILQRSAARGRGDDELRQIKGRLRRFPDDIALLQEYYNNRLITLDGQGTPEAVFTDFFKRTKASLRNA